MALDADVGRTENVFTGLLNRRTRKAVTLVAVFATHLQIQTVHIFITNLFNCFLLLCMGVKLGLSH
jgi:hypothetical protein